MKISAKCILIMLSSLLLNSFISAEVKSKTPSQPNFLFIIADDLGTRLGCYDDKAAKTPNLDKFAKDGIVFTRAYAQGSVCIPSRASFMLGKTTVHANSKELLAPEKPMTMGRWFREHGYQTFSVGKILHDETYEDPKAWDIRVPISECKRGAKGSSLQSIKEDLGPNKRDLGRYAPHEKIEAFDDWVRTERALKFFEKERDVNKPFFAAIGFHTSHEAFYSLKSIYDSFDSSLFTTEYPTPSYASKLPEGSLFDFPEYEVSDEVQRKFHRAYYAAVSTMDQEIGRLMEMLKNKGYLENTVVVFTSDQGYHLGWRGQWHKHSISEQVLHVPLVVRLPQGVKGAKAGGIVELLDIFPTFCEMASIPAPEKLDGISFLKLLHNPEKEGKMGAFCSMPKGWGNGRTVRTKRWRLIERNDGTRELYDHTKDPFEYCNLISSPENKRVIEEMQNMLHQEYGVLIPPKIKK